ncbi:hypothetical protein PHLGIDRAFT_448875 [Phlebiopsis gigantea 11061_1 CR5-6]|uniref:Uncharacterized protein n=1 Tax=Phlebiopsis gigantea (strain 11061_1 CR5-6) TaxID=745531 RepID=A0A0C3RXN8_PHLG1|nr:hypothetical protein PHLGIDRAFT_448875 [Phlebiopsis gigantea 11061_1 CR5-6]
MASSKSDPVQKSLERVRKAGTPDPGDLYVIHSAGRLAEAFIVPRKPPIEEQSAITSEYLARNLAPAALGGTNYFLPVYGTDFDDQLPFIPFVSKDGLGFYTIAEWWGKTKMEESANLEAFPSFESKKYYLLWEISNIARYKEQCNAETRMTLGARIAARTWCWWRDCVQPQNLSPENPFCLGLPGPEGIALENLLLVGLAPILRGKGSMYTVLLGYTSAENEQFSPNPVPRSAIRYFL